MENSLSLQDIRDLTIQVREAVFLTSRPIGIKIVADEAEIPCNAKRPGRRNMRWPVCLAANMVRNMGWTVGLTVDDHFCAFAAAGLGHMALPDYLRNGEMGKHHTKDVELGRRFQDSFEKQCFLPANSTKGVLLTPMTEPGFAPQGMMVYGSPSQIGKIAKAVTWFRGEAVPVSAGGFGGCIKAAATIRAGECAIVLPCSGEKILGHTEENDIFLACSLDYLPGIVQGLKGTDKVMPYPTAKYMMFEPKATQKYPIDMKSYLETEKDVRKSHE